jgi:hypothetical protein
LPTLRAVTVAPFVRFLCLKHRTVAKS